MVNLYENLWEDMQDGLDKLNNGWLPKDVKNV